MVFMYYSIFTIRKNTWGGARVETKIQEKEKEKVEPSIVDIYGELP